MSDDSLQFEKIRRIIQTSPCGFKQNTNSKLSYAGIKRIIETSPLEKKKKFSSGSSKDRPLDKSMGALESFVGKQDSQSKLQTSHETERKSDEQEAFEQKPANLQRFSKTGKAKIFVGKRSQGVENANRDRELAPVARGKSWITVKVD